MNACRVEKQSVISGISGRFPNCDNVLELEIALKEGKQLVFSDSTRWPIAIYGMPPVSALIKNIHKFDNKFFNLKENVNYIDPQTRIYYEVIYEAIWDAGVNPADLRNNRTALLGSQFQDDTHAINYGCVPRKTFDTVAADFGFQGPTLDIENACASSLTALKELTILIEKNICDSGVIVCSSLALNPFRLMEFWTLGVISKEGRMKCLDESANGYVRSEAVVAILVQRQSIAKRIYAKILGCAMNSDGYKVEGYTFPNTSTQAAVMKEAIEDSGINPLEVEYIEAHMTATKAGEPNECSAIIEAFRGSSKKPLLVGCLKSNIGHTEVACGICAVIKVIYIFQKDLIPANLNYKKPNPNIPSLMSGQLIPVTRNTEFRSNVIAVDNFGMGGSNACAILMKYDKIEVENSRIIADDIPRIINICGRTEEGLIETFAWIEKNKQEITKDFLSLLNDVSKIQLESGMFCRGYLIIDKYFKILRRQLSFGKQRHELCFWFTGFDGQMPVIDTELMLLTPFEKSIAESAKIAKQIGVDFMETILYKKSGVELMTEKFELNCLAKHVAIQIAFYDTLNYLDIKPDKCFGILTGKLVISYITGNLKRDEIFKALVSNNHTLKNMNENIDALNELDENACIVAINSQQDVINDKRPNNKIITLASNTQLVQILSAVGEIYIAGNNPSIEKLYPKVTYPVARKTHYLSPLLKWDHSEDHFVTKYCVDSRPLRKIVEDVNLDSSDYSFLADHAIDGRIIFPAAGYVYFALRQFAIINGFRDISSLVVNVKDLKFTQALIVEKASKLTLVIDMDAVSGKYTIVSNGYVCATGKVTMAEKIKLKYSERQKHNSLKLDKESVYKEFRVRGFDFGANFQTLIEVDVNTYQAKVQSLSHMIAYLDSVIQFCYIINNNCRSIYVPTKIAFLYLDMNVIFENIRSKKIFDISFNKYTRVAFGGGILANNIFYAHVPRRADVERRLQYKCFASLDNHFESSATTRIEAKRYTDLCVQLIHYLKRNNFMLTDALNSMINDFQHQRFSLLKFLNKAVEMKTSFEQFTSNLSEKELNLNQFNSRKEEIIEEQFNIFAANATAKNISVLEIGHKDASLETLFSNVAQSYNVNYKYEILKIAGCISPLQSTHDLIIYEDRTSYITTQHIHVYADLFKKVIDEAYQRTIERGFFLCNFRTHLNKIEQEIINMEFSETSLMDILFTVIKDYHSLIVISLKRDEIGFTSVLLRKIESQLCANSVITETNVYKFSWIHDVKTILKDKSKQIWLKGKPKDVSGIIGLTKHLVHEYGSERIRCVFDERDNIREEILQKDLIFNVVRNERHGILTLKNLCQPLVITEHAFVDLVTRGDLTSFQWFESQHKLHECLQPEDKKGTFLIYTYFAALNFKDVMNATNRVNFRKLCGTDAGLGEYSSKIGIEFSGIDEYGTRLYGMCSSGLATTISMATDGFYFEVPPKWTLEEASTVISVYATVYYALIQRGKLQKKETVLIHAGSGGVGQAAIRVCLSMDCEIFTSVGTEQKKQKLMKLFPQLKEKNLVNSRSVSFEEHIMKETDGRGVDIVLNSLSEEKMHASWNCLAEWGRFLEIGKYDIGEDTPIGIYSVTFRFLNPFLLTEFTCNNLSFEVIALDILLFDALRNKVGTAMKTVNHLRQLLTDGINNNVIQPLCTNVFDRNEIEDAFRFMASGKHFGKVVIKMRNENSIIKELKVTAIPRAYFYPSKVYLIYGGLGGMGLQLSYWLTERGATKIVLTSRKGVRTAYQKYMISLIERKGTQVNIIVNETEDNLVAECSKFGTVGGIFNTAMVLENELFEGMTEEMWSDVCKPKINATEILDETSRTMCPYIDYFVCFSSYGVVVGIEGQTNYAFANSAMEMICKRRRRDGFHALAIEWGLIGDVGHFSENQAKSSTTTSFGLKQQRISSCFEALDIFLASSHAVCCSAVPTKSSSSISCSGRDHVKQIMQILGVKELSLEDEKKTIGEYGADSLMLYQIRELFGKRLEIGNKDLRNMTLAEAKKHLYF